MSGKTLDVQRSFRHPLHVGVLDLVEEFVERCGVHQGRFESFVQSSAQRSVKDLLAAPGRELQKLPHQVAGEAYLRYERVARSEVMNRNRANKRAAYIPARNNLFFDDQHHLVMAIDNPFSHHFLPFLPAPRVLGGSQGVGTLSLGGTS